MPRHTETRVLPYTPEQLFDLVADVGSYQEFLPWVAATRIREDSATEMVADLIVGFKALKETFTSKVRKSRPSEIVIDYVEGPLKHLHNSWKFRAVSAGTEVDFRVDFAFRSRIFEAIAGQMFDRALRQMIGAFEARAADLYGVDASGRSSDSAQSAA